jgi:hypothetical protein
MDLDLTQLSTDQLLALKARLDGLTDTSGRTGNRPRQLHDLRLQPTATDARPMFIWSAESPRDRDVSKQNDYPRLMWHTDTAKEICVHSVEERDEKLSQGYQLVAPTTTQMTPTEILAEDLASLTDEEREIVLAEQQKARVKSVQERLAGLSEAQLEKLLSQATKPRRMKKTA